MDLLEAVMIADRDLVERIGGVREPALREGDRALGDHAVHPPPPRRESLSINFTSSFRSPEAIHDLARVSHHILLPGIEAGQSKERAAQAADASEPTGMAVGTRCPTID
ncbi:MAG: hypothetical protein FJX54_24100 [Alphaproteobacteria bacterium]|nr:hypothetical protein [Alphaproteobacteria bacterium]